MTDGISSDWWPGRRARSARTAMARGFLLFTAYCACIPAANWLIGHVGTVCVPQGPCLIPVAPGLMAPSGVLMVGVALVLRDLVQRCVGASVALGAILTGTGLSALLASPSLALASAVSFLVSEALDFAVYTPLQRKRLVWAVALSSVAGAVADSVLFVGLAFGSLDYVAGQILGKCWAVLLMLPLIVGLRRRDAKLLS